MFTRGDARRDGDGVCVSFMSERDSTGSRASLCTGCDDLGKKKLASSGVSPVWCGDVRLEP